MRKFSLTELKRLQLSLLGKHPLLGVDFGTKRIGVAVTDPLWLGATPLMTVRNDGTHWRVLQQVCEDYQVGAIIVGMPLWDGQRQSRLLPLVQQFAIALERKTKVPVLGFDESYTTQEAEIRLRENRVRRKTREAGVDALAAAILLREVLAWIPEVRRKEEE